jgi:hypothetical protein
VNLPCGQNKYQSLELLEPVSCVRLHLLSLSRASTRTSHFSQLSTPKFAFQSKSGSGKALLFLSIFTQTLHYRNPLATEKLPKRPFFFLRTTWPPLQQAEYLLLDSPHRETLLRPIRILAILVRWRFGTVNFREGICAVTGSKFK